MWFFVRHSSLLLATVRHICLIIVIPIDQMPPSPISLHGVIQSSTNVSENLIYLISSQFVTYPIDGTLVASYSSVDACAASKLQIYTHSGKGRIE